MNRITEKAAFETLVAAHCHFIIRTRADAHRADSELAKAGVGRAGKADRDFWYRDLPPGIPDYSGSKEAA